MLGIMCGANSRAHSRLFVPSVGGAYFSARLPGLYLNLCCDKGSENFHGSYFHSGQTIHEIHESLHYTKIYFYNWDMPKGTPHKSNILL